MCTLCTGNWRTWKFSGLVVLTIKWSARTRKKKSKAHVLYDYEYHKSVFPPNCEICFWCLRIFMNVFVAYSSKCFTNKMKFFGKVSLKFAPFYFSCTYCTQWALTNWIYFSHVKNFSWPVCSIFKKIEIAQKRTHYYIFYFNLIF